MIPSSTFLIAASVLAISPGPGIAYVVARTVAGGRSEGIASCLGTATGGLVHVLAAAFGLSLIVARSAAAFAVVKYVGAAYLIYLGARMLASRTSAAQLPQIRRAGPAKALRDGIIVEALNVKTAMFFLAFLPQFITPGQGLAPQFILLGAICVTLNTAADVLAVILADRLTASEAARAARGRLLSRVSGVTMLGLGFYVALTERRS
jgi:threonine/homoserine/homoserine lactone efflux protein